MEVLELVAVFEVMGVEFDKKTGEKESSYRAMLLCNQDNKSQSLGVHNIKASSHEKFIEEVRKSGLKKLEKKELDFETVNINDIMM